MQKVLIYSTEKSPRLLYILTELFTRQLKVDFELVSDLELFKKADALKINYSHQNIANSIQIKPHTLLFEKGIHGDTVEKELAKYESTELERAKKALKKKEALLQEESPFKRKEKLFRFLISRGFTISITREALTNFSSYSHDE